MDGWRGSVGVKGLINKRLGKTDKKKGQRKNMEMLLEANQDNMESCARTGAQRMNLQKQLGHSFKTTSGSETVQRSDFHLCSILNKPS